MSPHARCVPIAITLPRRRCRPLCPPCELKQPRQAHRRRSCLRCRLDASRARVVRECRGRVEDGRATSPVSPPPPSQLPSSCAVDGRVGEARKRPVPRQSSSTFASWEHRYLLTRYVTTLLLVGPPRTRGDGGSHGAPAPAALPALKLLSWYGVSHTIVSLALSVVSRVSLVSMLVSRLRV